MAPSKPFEESNAKELDKLLAASTIKPIKYNYTRHASVRFFGSQIVCEVKGKTILAPYEKLKLVIKGFNDQKKEVLLITLLII